MPVWPVGGNSGRAHRRLMAGLCGSTETRTGLPCRRRRNVPCSDHRGGPVRSPRRRRRTGRPVAPATASPAEKTVIDTAADVTTDGWKAAVAKRSSDLLGSALWGEVQAARHSGCAPLAAAARKLMEAKDEAHALVADILVGESPADRAGRCLSQLLRSYATKIPIPGEEVYEISARTLRIMGIYICTIAGELNRCECLHDLAEIAARDKLEEVIAVGLDHWANKIPAKVRPSYEP